MNDLRSAGVSSINFELIYGLPHQTTDTFLRTIDLCREMAPDRIALFGYAHVPWMAKRQGMIPEAALPGAAERMDQAAVAAATHETDRTGAAAREALADMEQDGLVAWDAGRLVIAKEGLNVVRVVAAAFDAYFQEQRARHSVAV